MYVVLTILVLVIGLMVLGAAAERRKVNAMSPHERQAYLERKRQARLEAAQTMAHGPVNAAMICPHCQHRGAVRTKEVDRKKGISGGKATAALLTGGTSMLVTGLSRKEQLTRAHCGHCGNGWDF